ncbi:hypothetical protein, partial [Pseudonocardia adelaidensis]|uniref:hypothetical protein n=1 Tax=Pseudonocardia adelaidensis TaxID=648754 RepID=UPI0031E83371
LQSSINGAACHSCAFVSETSCEWGNQLLDRRVLLLLNQQENFNTYTRKFRPWKMMALFEVSNDKTIALNLERYIKKQKSKKFLERLCDENQELSGVLAQLVRVPKLRD